MHNIYTRSSLSRKKKFKLITSFEKGSSGRIVTKRPAHPDASQFLESLPDKETELAEMLVDYPGVETVPLEYDSGVVRTKHIKGTTLDEMFVEALLRRDAEQMIVHLRKVLEIIDGFSTTDGVVSRGFKDIFGNYTTELKDREELLDIGYIDFNLDNFIATKDRLYLIDYEFKYDFGVPKQYVINRLLISYLLRYSSLFGQLATKDFQLLAIGEGLFVPKAIWDAFSKRFKSLEASLSLEKSFQEYYNYSTFNLSLYPESEWGVIEEPITKAGDSINEGLRAHVEQLEATLRATSQHADNLENMLDTTKNELAQRTKRLQKIENHWLLKYLIKIRKLFVK